MIASGPTRNSAVTSQRFEFKYRLSEVQAMTVRECIFPYVQHDSHANSDGLYALRSLYYDSPDMRLYWSSALGERNRHKLRVRWYGDERPATTFLEVKRRNDLVVRKARTQVATARASATVRGDLDGDRSPDSESFRQLAEVYQAMPAVLVRYSREAYGCVGGGPVRITFDREVAGIPCPSLEAAIDVAEASLYPAPDIGVIMEVKFTDSFPRWLSTIVRRLQLRPRSTCKYGLCVEELERRGFPFGAVRVPSSIHA